MARVEAGERGVRARPGNGAAAGEQRLIGELRSTRVLVVHPPDQDGDVLVRQLRRIGCQVRTVWPTPARLPEDLDVVFVLIERAGSTAAPPREAASGPALVAVVEYENPTILRGLLDSGAQAVLAKPLHPAGLLSTLVLARAQAAYERRLQTKIRKLEDQLRARRDVERATRLLMQIKQLSEVDAYELMRSQATRLRLPLAEVAARLLGASDVLGGIGLLPPARED